MRIKVTKRQFKLMLDNIDIIGVKGIGLKMDIRTLRYVLDIKP
jgi:hypothetical protein